VAQSRRQHIYYIDVGRPQHLLKQLRGP
jgi:hypothetical protein